MVNIFTKIPWKQVLKVASYVGTGVFAAKQAFDEDKQKALIKTLSEEVDVLKEQMSKLTK